MPKFQDYRENLEFEDKHNFLRINNINIFTNIPSNKTYISKNSDCRTLFNLTRPDATSRFTLQCSIMSPSRPKAEMAQSSQKAYTPICALQRNVQGRPTRYKNEKIHTLQRQYATNLGRRKGNFLKIFVHTLTYHNLT